MPLHKGPQHSSYATACHIARPNAVQRSQLRALMNLCAIFDHQRRRLGCQVRGLATKFEPFLPVSLSILHSTDRRFRSRMTILKYINYNCG